MSSIYVVVFFLMFEITNIFMEQLLQFQEGLYNNADARNELFEKK